MYNLLVIGERIFFIWTHMQYKGDVEMDYSKELKLIVFYGSYILYPSMSEPQDLACLLCIVYYNHESREMKTVKILPLQSGT